MAPLRPIENTFIQNEVGQESSSMVSLVSTSACLKAFKTFRCVCKNIAIVSIQVSLWT